jgi:ankyrin repeat protein
MPSPHTLFLEDYEYYDALGRDPLQERKIWGISNDALRVEKLKEALDDFPKQMHRRQMLLKAVVRGDKPIVRCLVDTGLKIHPDIEKAVEKEEENADDGDAEEGDIPDKDDESVVPLHTAAFQGQLEIVKLFIEIGVPVDVRDEFGRTPLGAAAGGCHPAIIRYLLGQGANPTVRTYANSEIAKEMMGLYAGADVLEIAASHGNVEALRMLLEHPIYGSTRKRKHREDKEPGVWVTPLAIRGAAGASIEALRLLLEQGAYPLEDKDGKTKGELLNKAEKQAILDATPVAAEAGDLESLKLLLSYQYPADKDGNILPFQVPETLHKPFIYGAYTAMVKNQPKKVEYIHSFGLKEHDSMSLDELPDGQTLNIQHLFDKAAQAGSIDCAQLMIEKYGADPDKHRMPPGMQPLYVAAANDKPEMVRYLLENHKINIHFGSGRFATGPTALWIAIVLKSFESVAHLLKHGGPVNHIDEEILNLEGPVTAILRAVYDDQSSVRAETESNAKAWIDGERTNFQRPNPAYVRVQLGLEDKIWIQKLQYRRSGDELRETGEGAREFSKKEATKLRDLDEEDVRRILAPFPTLTEREKMLKNHDDLIPEWKPAFVSAQENDSD